MATRPPHPPTSDERLYAALYLLSLALRPDPSGADTSAVRSDRADLWKLAADAGSPLGRNKFHAAVASLAEDEDGSGWGCVVIVTREAGNRRSVTVLRPDADPDGWDEALESVGLTIDSATKAALKLGLDIDTALPGDLLQPLPAGEDAGDEDEDEFPTKVCTKCREAKPATDAEGVDGFPVRTNSELSSWCRACTRAATKAAVARRHPNRKPVDPAARKAAALEAAKHPGQKKCATCRKWIYRSSFHIDQQKSDGLMAVCKRCHHDRRANQRQRASIGL